LYFQIVSVIERNLTDPALPRLKKFCLEWEIKKFNEDIERWTATKEMLIQEKKRLEEKAGCD